MAKRWIIKDKYDTGWAERFPELNPIVLQLLFNRGLDSQDKIDCFLGPDYLRDQNDPFLFGQMKVAVGRIFQAIKQKESIVIYGDYDADGVTSTAVLSITLKKLGAEKLNMYIPNRMTEGYGMNMEAVEELAKNGTNLIITVDCGISNKAEIALAKERGMEVIITDHHMEPAEIPSALAVICPTLKKEKYPFKKLAGVGVAFKLAQALLRSDKKQNNDAFEKWLLDLVAIGTIADSMPLLEENRTLVKWGLIVLNKTQRLGLKELMTLAQATELDTHGVAFQIAPRLNAAGRMDHANTAFELLVTEDEAEAVAISTGLNQKNQARQKVTEEMMKISLEQIGQPSDEEKILFSAFDGWSPGLVGLAAGKLCDKFNRPVIVFGKSGEEYVASGRSVPEFDITGALNDCREYLAEFGGHEQACGLTIQGEDNYEKFKDKIRKIAGEKLAGIELKPRLLVEVEMTLKEANWEVIDALEKFEPFGEGNREPLFVTKKLKVEEITTMGTVGQHLRLGLSDINTRISRKFVGFGLSGEWVEKIKIGDKVYVVYEFGVNEWNGNRELQFKIVDLKISG
jgi:single-stranded-DNA-specific exonuclease